MPTQISRTSGVDHAMGSFLMMSAVTIMFPTVAQGSRRVVRVVFSSTDDKIWSSPTPDDQSNFSVTFYAIESAYSIAQWRYGRNAIASEASVFPAIPLFFPQKMGRISKLIYNLPVYRGVWRAGLGASAHPRQKNTAMVEFKTHVAH
jgi:hypothetical protein